MNTSVHGICIFVEWILIQDKILIIGDVQWVGCSTLLIENSQQQRQTGAAVESFRNETVRESQKNRTMYEDMMKQKQLCQFKSIHLKIFGPLMNLTVIIDDKAIYIDGFVVQPADMSWFNPDDYDRKVNAIQWEEDSGEIEYTEGPPTPIDNIDFLKDVISIHQLAKEEFEKDQEAFRKQCELSALVEYNEDDPKLEFVDYDETRDIDEDKLNDILDEIDFDLEDEPDRGYAELVHADDEDGPESVEDILGIGTLDQEPVPQTEDNDIMHEDLRDALDTQEDSSYEMEEEVENQIYYDIEELLKEI